MTKIKECLEHATQELEQKRFNYAKQLVMTKLQQRDDAKRELDNIEEQLQELLERDVEDLPEEVVMGLEDTERRTYNIR